MEPLRERLTREQGIDWRIVVSARYADRTQPRIHAFGHVELAGRPVPPNDREQWAVLEVEEGWEDPMTLHVSAYTDAWEDSQEMAGNHQQVAEQFVSLQEAATTLVSFVPTLAVGLERLFRLYGNGARGRVR